MIDLSKSYIPFSEEQKEQARTTDIVSLLESQGETVKRSGKEYEWRDGSAKVTLRGNLWFHQYDREGGDAIDFMKRFYNMEYSDAVLYLTGGSMEKLCKWPEQEQDYPELVLPERNGNMRRVFAYLTKQRGIDRSVVEAFAHHGMIYESAKYHNVVFVGYDREGRPRHANLRGTGRESTFKGNAPNSNPAYSFHWHGSSSALYLFEAPIDLMSYLSLHPEDWRENSYAAACSVSDRVLFQMLEDNRNISQVSICFDSDEPGQSAARRIDDKLFTMGIKSQILVPNHKDWNEDLVCLKSESEVMEPCQSIGL